LSTSALTVRFGGLVALDDLSFSVGRGEIHGLIGPNGAGKTTLFNAISGLVRPLSGRIVFGGEDITSLPVHRRAGRGIRRTFQTIQLIQNLSVLENVLIGLHDRIVTGPFALVVRRGRGGLPDVDAQSRVHRVLAFLGIEGVILNEVASLSFAQQRYVEIARALVAQPGLLMLDEPAAGLSPDQVDQLDALLRRLRDEWDMTILLVEHLVSLVAGICDRVTVLDRGRVIAEGSGKAVLENSAVKAAYLGTSDAESQ
jgi:branched-chain amino acid transport system ATP-binding protein